jgi:hypothetical protein
MTSSPIKKLFSCACITLLSTLAACGSPETNDQAIENNANEGTDFNIGVETDARVHIVTSSGRGDSGNRLPENWPDDVPVYPDAKVVYSAAVTTEGQDGLALTLSTSHTLAQVVKFYNETLAAKGWTALSTLESGGTSIIGAEKGDRVFAASITNTGGQTMISVGVGKNQ